MSVYPGIIEPLELQILQIIPINTPHIPSLQK